MMPFLPFLSVPVTLFSDDPEKEPTAKQIMLRLNPQCIEGFYPCFYEGSMIVMMSGEKYMTPATCEQLEAGIFNYWANVNQKMNQEKPIESGRIVTLNPQP